MTCSNTAHQVVVLFLLWLGMACDAYWDGIVSVDSSSLDKLMTPDVITMLKIDVKHPHGPAMDEWRKFARAVAERGPALADVILLEVNCHHEWWWNDDSYFNMDLAKRFNVSLAGASVAGRNFVPPVFLFRKVPYFGAPIRFKDDEFTAANLMRMLQKHAADSFLSLPGTLRCFDAECAMMLRAPSTAAPSSSGMTRRELLKRVERMVESRSWLKPPLAMNATLAMGPHDARRVCDDELSNLAFDDVRKADVEYIIEVMKDIIQNGTNAALLRKQEIAEHLKATRAKGASKTKHRGKRVDADRLERNLNILSVFRSPASVPMAEPRPSI